MKSRLQTFSEKFGPLTAEEVAKLDAELAAERSEPPSSSTRQAPAEVEPGMNWAYLSQVAANNPRAFEAEAKSSAAEKSPAVVEVGTGQQRKWQWSANTVFAIAASLLVGAMVGIFANRGGSPAGTQVALADVTLTTRDNARAGNDAKDYFLEVDQPFDGFVSWVLLVPGEAAEVFPTLGGEMHKIAIGKRESIGPVPPAAEVIVIITEQPANDFLRQQLDTTVFRSGDAQRIKDMLVSTLTDSNYKRISAAVKNVPAEPAK